MAFYARDGHFPENCSSSQPSAACGLPWQRAVPSAGCSQGQVPQCPPNLVPSVPLVPPEQLPHSHQRTPKDWCPALVPCPSPPPALCKTLTPLETAGTFVGLRMPCEKGPRAALRALVPPQTPPGSTGGSFPRGAEEPCSTLRHRTHRAPRTHHMLVLRSHPEGRTQTPFVAFPSY